MYTPKKSNFVKIHYDPSYFHKVPYAERQDIDQCIQQTISQFQADQSEIEALAIECISGLSNQQALSNALSKPLAEIDVCLYAGNVTADTSSTSLMAVIVRVGWSESISSHLSPSTWNMNDMPSMSPRSTAE